MHAPLPGDEVVLAVAALLVLGVLSSGLADRIRVPGLLVFLGIGMALGSDGLDWIHVGFRDLELVQALSVVALVVILYEGGLSTSTSSLRRVVAPAAALATVGVATTAGVVALAAGVILDVDATTAILVGAVVASTDAAAVLSVLRGSPLPRRTTDLLAVESGFNDPMAVLLTIGALEVWHGSPTTGDWLVFGATELVGGLVVGAAAGYAGSTVLDRFRLGGASLYPVFALGVAGVAYGAAAAVGASGFLAVYVAGLVVGNRGERHRRAVHSFHAGLGSMAEIGLFLLLGLLVFPSDLVDQAGRGLLVALVLVLVARPLAVAVCLPWFRVPAREGALLAWAGLRGAVPIVLATFPLSAGHPQGALIFEVAFFVVLLSAAVQGLTVVPLAVRLGLADAPEPWAPMVDVIPFERIDGELVDLEIGPASPLARRRLADVPPPGGARVAALVRAGKVLVPTGDTVLATGDRLLAVSTGPAQRRVLADWAAGPGADDPT